MIKSVQRIYSCDVCGHTFEDGQDFWIKWSGEAYCIDCGIDREIAEENEKEDENEID